MKFKDIEIQLNDSWKTFFEGQNQNLEKIEKNIGEIGTFTPIVSKIFNVFNMPLQDVKYIILGQDPYPQEDIATGLAFEVNQLQNWSNSKINRSLQNILKSIYYHVNKKYKPVSTSFSKIKYDVQNIYNPPELFKNWSDHGVFLLNLSLTCKKNKSNFHKKYWQCFSDALIEHIVTKRGKDIKWLIWGKEAKNAIERYQDLITIISEDSPHPATRWYTKKFIVTSGFHDEGLLELCKK